MLQFRFKARNQQGELITGLREGESADSVAKELSEDGITPIDISEAAGNETVWHKLFAAFRRGGSSLDDLILFCRQMYTLTRAGVPLVRGINGLVETSRNKLLADVLRQIRDDLEGGHEFSTAMARFPVMFSPLMISMVRVGEATGRLDTAFIQLAQYLELERDTLNRIKTALRYPTLVIVAITVAIAIINIYVIPAFVGVFHGLNTALPWQTRLLLNVSALVTNWWPVLLAVLVSVVVMTRLYVRSPPGKYRWDTVKLRLPLVGQILLRATLVRFARTFAVAMRAGVPLVQALEVTAQAVDNGYLGERILGMRAGVERGDSLSQAAAASTMFTPLVLQMLAIGEETGEIDTMMEEVAAFYEREVDYDIKNLSTTIEPVLIIAIGIMVLILALGVFLPMWDLTQLAHH